MVTEFLVQSDQVRNGHSICGFLWFLLLLLLLACRFEVKPFSKTG